MYFSFVSTLRIVETLHLSLEDRIDSAVNNLEERGFEVVVYTESFEVSKFGNDTAQLRADLFNKAVSDPEIKAIFAFCGGYGSMHLLDKIDYEAFRENRKIFVGFSDVIAIQSAILEKAGVMTFHAPMLGATYNCQETICFDNLFDILMNPKEKFELYNIDDNTKFKALKSDTCEGRIFGGTLSLVQCLMGTPYEPDWKDKILFFDDLGENAYRIHRTLWHFKLDGRLDKLAGIIIGTLTPEKGETEEELLESCFDMFKDLKIPVIYNFHAGHIKNPLTIPVGANLQIEDEKVMVIEPVVKLRN
ncbi:MAG: LD-carboxypeptidase [Oscillospiraceae bacterium]|nr:LD-carboxypeptidase [Oscillospiraceae bacterium]